MRQSSRRRFEEVSAFLKNELQKLHDNIARPDGLLLEDDLRHSGNRHAEVQLRQLGMGLRQSMATCSNLAKQMGMRSSGAAGFCLRGKALAVALH
jgi:hypothetical protein